MGVDPHGVGGEGLAHLREIANRVIDTTSLTVHQLKDQMVHSYGPQEARGALTVSLVSFGFKHGVPYDADLVFDVRFLRNPHYVAALRPLTGRDPEVAAFIAADPDFAPFLERLCQWLEPLLPRFEREGKSYLTIAFGCTGGRHRSPVLAEELRAWLAKAGYQSSIRHQHIAI